jgi:hypothetical protein
MTAHIFILYHITKNEDDKAKKPANQYGDDGEKHSFIDLAGGYIFTRL